MGFRFLPLLPLCPTSQWPLASPGRGAAWERGSPPRALPKLTRLTTTSVKGSWGLPESPGPHLEPGRTNQPTAVH